MKLPNRFKLQKGVSLVEVLLVIVIIGFITLLIFNLPSSIGLIGTSRYSSLAKDIAAKEIEDLRAIGYDNLSSNGSSVVSDPRLANLPQGQATLITSDCGVCTNNESTKQIKVTISWQEKSQIKNIELTTLISQGGLK